MITASTYIGIALMIVFGLAIPAAAAVWWLKSRKEKITTVLLGAATWFVFAMILETVPKAILFNPALAVGKVVMANAALYTVFGALMAGLFEETGRFIVFKTFLRRQTNRETGVSHGIGHGGMEAVFTLAVSGAQNFVFAVLIGTGMFQSLVDKTAVKGADVSALQALPQQILSITPGTACLAGAERIFAMLLHVGLSVLVFYAVKQSRPLWYVLAILLHALFDVPAALYQFGVIKDVYLVEAMIAVFAVAAFAIAYRALYRPDKPAQTAEE